MDATQWQRDRKACLVNYKGGCCFDCKGVFPQCCYDFDHRDPSQKSFSISDAMRRGVSISDLTIEADKCDLVCANCHRIRTAGNPKIAQKISAGSKGNVPWNKGLMSPYCEDTIRRMADGQKKRFQNSSGPNKGRVWTEEEKRKMSESHKVKGIKPSLEACSKGGQRKRGQS